MLKIDILVQPKDNPEQIEKAILFAAQKVKVEVKIQRTSDFKTFSHISVNPALCPIVIINGKVEFTKMMPDQHALQQRLLALDRKGNTFF